MKQAQMFEQSQNYCYGDGEGREGGSGGGGVMIYIGHRWGYT